MPDPRPNIILIITDQQRYDTIGALGFPYVDTPHLDRLVAEGTVFTNCFVSAASCAGPRQPSPGTHPHTTGTTQERRRRRSWVELSPRRGTLRERRQDAHLPL